MILRNLIELIIVAVTASILIPLFLNKRKKVKDLDGFEMLDSNSHPEQEPDEIIMIEQEH